MTTLRLKARNGLISTVEFSLCLCKRNSYFTGLTDSLIPPPKGLS